MTLFQDIIAKVSALAAWVGDEIQLRGFKVGGTVGQVPVKTGSGDFAWGWGNVTLDLSGYVPVTRTINGQPLTGDITISTLPTQAGAAGKYLTTDGSVASWGTIDLSSYATTSALGTLATQNGTFVAASASLDAGKPIAWGASTMATLTSLGGTPPTGTGSLVRADGATLTGTFAVGSPVDSVGGMTIVYHPYEARMQASNNNSLVLKNSNSTNSVIIANSAGATLLLSTHTGIDVTNLAASGTVTAPSGVFTTGADIGDATRRSLTFGGSSLTPILQQSVNTGCLSTSIVGFTANTYVTFGYSASGDGTPGYVTTSKGLYLWSSSTSSCDANTSKDTGLARNAAGVVEVNNGTAGTLRDLSLRNLTATGTVTSRLEPSTVGTLPTASTNPYLSLAVTDALAPVLGATVASGGSAKATVRSNGTDYIVTEIL